MDLFSNFVCAAGDILRKKNPPPSTHQQLYPMQKESNGLVINANAHMYVGILGNVHKYIYI